MKRSILGFILAGTLLVAQASICNKSYWETISLEGSTIYTLKDDQTESELKIWCNNGEAGSFSFSKNGKQEFVEGIAIGQNSFDLWYTKPIYGLPDGIEHAKYINVYTKENTYLMKVSNIVDQFKCKKE